MRKKQHSKSKQSWTSEYDFRFVVPKAGQGGFGPDRKKGKTRPPAKAKLTKKPKKEDKVNRMGGSTNGELRDGGGREGRLSQACRKTKPL